jgi:hypothetical protein
LRERSFLSEFRREATANLRYVAIFIIWLLVRELIPDDDLNPPIEILLFFAAWLVYSLLATLASLRPMLEVRWKFLGDNTDFFLGPRAVVPLPDGVPDALLEVHVFSQAAENRLARRLLSRACDAHPEMVLEFKPPVGLRLACEKVGESLQDKVKVDQNRISIFPTLHGSGFEGWFGIGLWPTEAKYVDQVWEVNRQLRYGQQVALGSKLTRTRMNVNQIHIMRTAAHPTTPPASGSDGAAAKNKEPAPSDGKPT